MSTYVVAGILVLVAGCLYLLRRRRSAPRPHERPTRYARNRKTSPVGPGAPTDTQVPVDVGGRVKRVVERRADEPDRRMGVGLASELYKASGNPERRKRSRGRRSRDARGNDSKT
jgi:hypothetical protein